MGYTSRFFAEPEVWMPWKESSVMEERLRFVARLLDGEPMTDVCRQFGISRKTGYKIFNRYRHCPSRSGPTAETALMVTMSSRRHDAPGDATGISHDSNENPRAVRAVKPDFGSAPSAPFLFKVADVGSMSARTLIHATPRSRLTIDHANRPGRCHVQSAPVTR
jgi:hypothetical protein